MRQPATLAWLVCVSGPERGAEYRLRAVRNYIGSEGAEICQEADGINRDSAAVIIYDEARRIFTFGSCGVETAVRLNGQEVTTAAVLSPYDVLTAGDSELLFVPLCTDRFHWPESPIPDAELEASEEAEEPEEVEEPEEAEEPEEMKELPSTLETTLREAMEDEQDAEEEPQPVLPVRKPRPAPKQEEDPFFPFFLAAAIVILLIGVAYYFL